MIYTKDELDLLIRPMIATVVTLAQKHPDEELGGEVAKVTKALVELIEQDREAHQNAQV